MTIENKLKKYVSEKYPTHKALAENIGISSSSLHDFYKSLDSAINSNKTMTTKTDKLQKLFIICKTLNISIDALARGEIVELKDEHPNLTAYNEDLVKLLSDTKTQISMIDEPRVNGKVIKQEDISTISTLVTIIIELIEKKYL
ncbi:MAG: hypothetical protein VZQ55_06500 [Ruminococcus sp.]|nr:hypothetical protein [Ruminococcus sp.]